jgi:hypothetical protein
MFKYLQKSIILEPNECWAGKFGKYGLTIEKYIGYDIHTIDLLKI